MNVLPDFGVTDVGAGANFANGESLDDLIYGAFLANRKINVFQLIVTTLLFLTVVAWVQFFFITLENIDSVNVALPTVVETNLSVRKQRQLKFAIVLTIVTALGYFLYNRFGA